MSRMKITPEEKLAMAQNGAEDYQATWAHIADLEAHTCPEGDFERCDTCQEIVTNEAHLQALAIRFGFLWSKQILGAGTNQWQKEHWAIVHGGAR